METLIQDIRYGGRMLGKNPAFTVVAVLTLALGIGANTAIMSVIDAALFHALPYRDPNRLVHLWETRPAREFKEMEASYPNLADWRASNQVFSDLAGYAGMNFSMIGRGTAQRVLAGRVTANFFDLLGVSPVLGRSFRPGDDAPGVAHTVLLTHALWQGQFGGDPGILGQSLTLDGQPYTVVGVLPPEFQFARRGGAQLWVPLNPSPNEMARRGRHWENVIGRLRPGVTLEQAQREMTRLAQQMAAAYPEANAGGGIRVVSLQDEVVAPVRPILLALLGAVGLVLLIACANVANLLLARAKTRQKEIAVRLAVGATRGRLLRQMLTESVILALAGGVLGLAIAHWGVELILARIPGQVLAQLPYLRASSLNLPVLGFTLALSLLTGIVFGIIPALQASGANLQSSLTEGFRTTGGATHHRLRNALVASEIALSLVLLTGAGLLMKSLVQLLRVDPGFRTENLLTLELSAPTNRYLDANRNQNLVSQLLDRVQSMPGVRGAALIDITPLRGGNTTSFTIQGRPEPLPGEKPEANTRDVSSTYFQVMEITLIRGRFFTDQDRGNSPPVLIVNQTFAERMFPGEDAVGKRLVFNFGTPPLAAEIVGVVGDEKLGALDQKTTPVLYSPSLQSNDTDLTLVVRSELDPQGVTSAVRSEVNNLDPNVVVNSALLVKTLISDSSSVFVRRFPALLISIFAVLAVLLSAIGIYGVLSYLVTQRTREIGVRMALGATRTNILHMLLNQGLRLIGLGIAFGLVVASATARLLTSMLFGVKPHDPWVIASVAALIAAVALLACVIPARRASKVDPMVALRYE